MEIGNVWLVMTLIVNSAAVMAQEEEGVQALNMLPKASTSFVSSDALGFSLGAGEPRGARAGFEDPPIALSKQGAKISSYSSQKNGFNFGVASAKAGLWASMPEERLLVEISRCR